MYTKIQAKQRNNIVITLGLCYNIILKLSFNFEKPKWNDSKIFENKLKIYIRRFKKFFCSKLIYLKVIKFIQVWICKQNRWILLSWNHFYWLYRQIVQSCVKCPIFNFHKFGNVLRDINEKRRNLISVLKKKTIELKKKNC